MKVAITGTSGHVGSNVTRRLLELGHDVRALKYRDERGIKGLEMNVVPGDILIPNTLDELFKDTDAAIHLAGLVTVDENKENLHRINVDGTRNVMDACLRNGIQRVIHFSTIHAIEHQPLDAVLDENREIIKHSNIPYEMSKAQGEKIVYEYLDKGLEVIVMNPTSIIGPFDFKPSLTGILFLQLYFNKIPMLVEGGYDWVDVRDVADAAINALENGRPGERYLLAGGWRSIKDISIISEKVTGRKTPQKVAPMWLAKAGLPFIRLQAKLTGQKPLYTKDSLDVIADSSKHISNAKAMEELNFNPRPLEETISDIYKWFGKNGFLR
jgi:dihydroflavonol-4-reductase